MRQLPKYVTRHKRDGKLYFQKHGMGQKLLRTQFPDGDPVPDALAKEIGEILASKKPSKKVAHKAQREAPKPNFFRELQKGARSRAKAAGREYRLPRAWAEAQFALQDETCAGSGLRMRVSTMKHDPWAASIDRIDSSEGYTPTNCRLVCYIYNCARNQFSDADLLKLSMAIVHRAVASTKSNA